MFLVDLYLGITLEKNDAVLSKIINTCWTFGNFAIHKLNAWGGVW